MKENMALGREDEFYFGGSPDILTSCVKVVLPTDCTGVPELLLGSIVYVSGK